MRGVVGVFHELDATVDAIERARTAGIGPVTAYSPTPRHEIEHAVHAAPSAVRRFTLIGGLLGVTFGFWIPIWISEYWPLVVGGKPIPSWVPYTIIGFEVMVLIGSLSTVAGMFANSRIPKITATAGYDPRFSGGSFGVFVECVPEKAREVEELLTAAGAVEVRRER